MPDGSDWLMLPVMRDKLRYESLLDGSVDLVDLGRLHDAIAVMDRNQQILSEK